MHSNLILSSSPRLAGLAQNSLERLNEVKDSIGIIPNEAEKKELDRIKQNDLGAIAEFLDDLAITNIKQLRSIEKQLIDHLNVSVKLSLHRKHLRYIQDGIYQLIEAKKLTCSAIIRLNSHTYYDQTEFNVLKSCFTLLSSASQLTDRLAEQERIKNIFRIIFKQAITEDHMDIIEQQLYAMMTSGKLASGIDSFAEILKELHAKRILLYGCENLISRRESPSTAPTPPPTQAPSPRIFINAPISPQSPETKTYIRPTPRSPFS